MLDQVFRRAQVRQRIGSNPIGDVLERYVAFLVGRGHRPSALHQYVFAVEHFGKWLGRRARGRRRSRQIDRRTVHQFIVGHLPTCRCAKPAVRNINCVRAALNRLLEMQGNKTPIQRHDPSPVGRLLAQYENHLVGVQGLSASTTHYRLRYTRAMLDRLGVGQTGQLKRWTPSLVAEFTASVGRRCKPSSGQVLACSLRSFLRFLLLRGLIDRDLASAVPSFANWRLASLPDVVNPAELRRLTDTVDTTTPVGRRDLAVLLCMTDLGLRASDIAALRLHGIDLSSRVLRLQRPKQRAAIALPMTRRLTASISAYLKSGRPRCDSASLFVIHRAPAGQAVTTMTVRNIVVRRSAQAGLSGRIGGPHVIRHSLASTLINRGASLKQIADLLGHRSIDTTSLYAKVDLASLSQVALPWPTTRREVRS